MLNDSQVTANVPAADLDRAHASTPTPSASRPTWRTTAARLPDGGGTVFFVYQTEFAGQAGHTIAQWHVDDLDTEVKDLQGQGLAFEHYDLPGVTWDGDIASLPGMGRAAWFKDSEGNIMCLDDMVSL